MFHVSISDVNEESPSNLNCTQVSCVRHVHYAR